ncbi:MAG: serine/threonine-protein kinase [Polyangiales bacterium]
MSLSGKNQEIVEDSTIEVLPHSEDPPEPERTGSVRIGRYGLCFELASGGMASVYLARIDGVSGFEKLVALKRIHRHLAKEQGYIDMFLDEAKIASRITHPNVCSVFDFGEADGEYYIAMEYLVGEPLSRVCGRISKDREHRRDPMLPLKMARIIADACEGLHAAHELKDASGELLHVVHRDVSPRNLFITYDGGVQVVDFGIASARERLHHTSTGQVKGTFAYMAPEQLTANPIDRRVDVWALGVTLWEMLAVKRLFRRDTTANTVHSVLYDKITPPSKYRTSVPKELDEIVLKALERDPEDRWQTARDMGRALRQFLGTRPDVVGPPELSEWMTEVFPQGEARQSQLMEVARMADASVPTIARADEADVTHSGTGLIADRPYASRMWLSRRARVGLIAAGVIAVAVAVLSGIENGDPPPNGEGVVAHAPSPPIAEPVAAIEPVPVDAPKAIVPERPTRKTRTKPVAQKKPGTINLVTRGGWAEVYKGNKSLGSTPQRLTLPAGRHKLVLKPFGDGKPKRVFVTVKAGATKQVSVSLN